jgi:hypothetical protein
MAAVTKKCECGAEFSVDQTLSKIIKLCPKCSRAAQALATLQDVERTHGARMRRWISLCPKAFLNTKREKLPFPEIYDKCIAWEYGHLGLLLHGVTGGGKSRHSMGSLAEAVLVRAQRGGVDSD